MITARIVFGLFRADDGSFKFLPYPLRKFIPHAAVIEASTAVLNLSWFNQEIWKSKSAEKLFANLFAVLFFSLRLCWFPYLIFKRMREPLVKEQVDRLPKFFMLACYILLLIQLYWFGKIFRKVLDIWKGS